MDMPAITTNKEITSRASRRLKEGRDRCTKRLFIYFQGNGGIFLREEQGGKTAIAGIIIVVLSWKQVVIDNSS